MMGFRIHLIKKIASTCKLLKRIFCKFAQHCLFISDLYTTALEGVKSTCDMSDVTGTPVYGLD